MPRSVHLNDLPHDRPLEHALFTHNGDLVLQARTFFSQEIYDVFVKNDIHDLLIPDVGQDEDDCAVSIKFREKGIAEIEATDILGLGVHDRSGRLLKKQGANVTEAEKATLVRQGATRAHVRRPLDASLTIRTRILLDALAPLLHPPSKLASAIESKRLSETRVLRDNEKLDEAALQRLTEQEAARTINLDSVVRGLVEQARMTDPVRQTDLDRVSAIRRRLYTQTSHLVNRVGAGDSLEADQFEALIRDTMASLVSDRHHRLHLSNSDEDNYIASHALTVLVLSINMAARMNYAIEEMIELSYAALLHDIGMLEIPAKIRDKTERLTLSERNKIESHPSMSIEVCRRIRRLPKSTPVAVLQENERLDGSGYPLKRRFGIHAYARIVALASSFDAMIRDRPYRRALAPYYAVRELLAEVQKGRLDNTAMRALLESFGLFPLGSAVQLSDDTTGYVLDSSGLEFARPVVCIGTTRMGEINDGLRVIDLADSTHSTTKIVKILSRETCEIVATAD